MGATRGALLGPKTWKRIVGDPERSVYSTVEASSRGVAACLSQAAGRTRMLAMSAMRRMGPSYDSSEEGASARAIQLALREAGLDRAVNGPTLELQREAERPPRLEAATPIEGSSLSTREIPEAPLVGFGAFLDGIQRSTVRAYRDGVPIVHGAVAAAIRVRDAKRMQVWERPLRSHACYLPAAALDAGIVDALRARCPVVDTLADHEPGTPVPRHPGDLAARALTAVQRDREAAEPLG